MKAENKWVHAKTFTRTLMELKAIGKKERKKERKKKWTDFKEKMTLSFSAKLRAEHKWVYVNNFRMHIDGIKSHSERKKERTKEKMDRL